MAYIDVITLQEAKNYLRVDDDLTEDDAQITRMINAALSFVEQWTQHYMFARGRSFRLINGCVRVYDYPINSITLPTDVKLEEKTLYTNFTHPKDKLLNLNVGYVLPADVPDQLLEVAYEIIDLLYYAEKGGESIEKRLSSMSIMTLNQYKRFLI